MNIIKQVLRGAGYLPYYGNHPGTFAVAVFIGLGALVGFQRGGGIASALIGAGAMSACILPLFFYGCYSRAVDSDKLVAEQKHIA